MASFKKKENVQVYEMKKYWNNRAKLYANRDKVGLAATCYVGHPEFYNKFFAYFQARAFSTLIKSVLEFRKEIGLILDMGCGTGRWLNSFRTKGDFIIGVDISSEMIYRAKKSTSHEKRELIIMSATNLGFKHSCFELVYSVQVLQHIPYDKQTQAIKEIKRVLKDRCFAIALEQTYMKEVASHVFPNTERNWIRKFSELGFEAVRVLPFEYGPLIHSLKLLIKLSMEIGSIIIKTFQGSIKRYTENRKNNFIKRIFSYTYTLILRLVVSVSYPLEFFLEKLSLSTYARDRAFLLRAIKNKE